MHIHKKNSNNRNYKKTLNNSSSSSSSSSSERCNWQASECVDKTHYDSRYD